MRAYRLLIKLQIEINHFNNKGNTEAIMSIGSTARDVLVLLRKDLMVANRSMNNLVQKCDNHGLITPADLLSFRLNTEALFLRLSGMKIGEVKQWAIFAAEAPPVTLTEDPLTVSQEEEEDVVPQQPRPSAEGVNGQTEVKPASVIEVNVETLEEDVDNNGVSRKRSSNSDSSAASKRSRVSPMRERTPEEGDQIEEEQEQVQDGDEDKDDDVHGDGEDADQSQEDTDQSQPSVESGKGKKCTLSLDHSIQQYLADNKAAIIRHELLSQSTEGSVMGMDFDDSTAESMRGWVTDSLTLLKAYGAASLAASSYRRIDLGRFYLDVSRIHSQEKSRLYRKKMPVITLRNFLQELGFARSCATGNTSRQHAELVRDFPRLINRPISKTDVPRIFGRIQKEKKEKIFDQNKNPNRTSTRTIHARDLISSESIWAFYSKSPDSSDFIYGNKLRYKEGKLNRAIYRKILEDRALFESYQQADEDKRDEIRERKADKVSGEENSSKMKVVSETKGNLDKKNGVRGMPKVNAGKGKGKKSRLAKTNTDTVKKTNVPKIVTIAAT